MPDNKQTFRVYTFHFVGLWCAHVEVVYLLIIKQVVTVPISPTESSDTVIAKGRYEPGVHTTIPYKGVVVTEGHGKYPIIF